MRILIYILIEFTKVNSILYIVVQSTKYNMLMYQGIYRLPNREEYEMCKLSFSTKF